MGQNEFEYCRRVSFAWNYRKDEEWLSDLSEQGLHLDKPGLYRNRFVRGEGKRYVYRLDYQSLTGKALQDYLALYEDAGWELVGTIMGWRYFRKPYAPGETFELYSDSASLKQFYARIQTIFLVIGLANLIVAGANAMNWFNLLRDSSFSSFGWIVWFNVLCAALMCFGWYKFERQKKRET